VILSSGRAGPAELWRPANRDRRLAGYSVEMLLRVYVRCVAGMEDVWIARMDAPMRLPGDHDGRYENK